MSSRTALRGRLRRHPANVCSMAALPTLPAEVRRILDVARADAAAATRELEALPLEAQVALVCSAPIGRRAELLGLTPFPEHVIPEIPEAELCFTAKAIGLADASWLSSRTSTGRVVHSSWSLSRNIAQAEVCASWQPIRMSTLTCRQRG